MDIGGYSFEGVYREIEEISDSKIGVYVVLCLVDGEPHCVLDIGTSEGGARATVTPTGNLQHRLKTHDRRRCWEENTHGDIGFCVRYIMDDEERIGLETELKWKYNHPCGTNQWEEIENAWTQYQEMEDRFGKRVANKI